MSKSVPAGYYKTKKIVAWTTKVIIVGTLLVRPQKKKHFFMCVFPNDNSEITFTTQFYHKLWKKRCVNVIMTLAGVFYIYYLNTEQIGW